VDSESVLDVEIKPGMSDGETIVFSEQCSESPSFDIPGDVVLVIRQLEDPTSEWIRSSKTDLTVEIRLSIAESLLGFERDIVGHPSGETIHVVWNSGVLDMDVLHVAGKGMNSSGDALIVCRVTMETFTPEQIQQLKLVWPDWKEPESRLNTATINTRGETRGNVGV
jgi:DnaJ-class molecular chaperone